MKQFIARYMLYIYLNFIKDEDVEIYRKWAIPLIKVINFFSGIYIWTASILFFPFFILGMKFDENKKIFLKNNKYIL
jgi:hypothetical protein